MITNIIRSSTTCPTLSIDYISDGRMLITIKLTGIRIILTSQF
ncbi:hypothetical protein T10_4614 [Trichinella papuae]|uniref:Uncharacterized protein n=1 Tax=Trichinella papuae TaxID=268474 RepID=A0A0V1LY53_9BILA|nr:hypothetical protein T10_4614 [Trichinella papuae]